MGIYLVGVADPLEAITLSMHIVHIQGRSPNQGRSPKVDMVFLYHKGLFLKKIICSCKSKHCSMVHMGISFFGVAPH